MLSNRAAGFFELPHKFAGLWGIGHNRPGLQHDNAALALRGNASKLDARDEFHLLFRRRKRRLSEVEGLGFTSFWIDVLDESHGIELTVKDIDPLHEFDGLIEERDVLWIGNMLGSDVHDSNAFLRPAAL